MTLRIGFLGPHGTFTEEAVLSQPDLATADLLPIDTIPGVLNAVESGDADLGLVAIENAIEGSVRVTLDTLAFEADLLIQREVVLDIVMTLMAAPGTTLDDVEQVISFPVAVAQCRDFLRTTLPAAEIQAANSTAEAARRLGESHETGVAAIGTALAAELYGLDVLATDIEDHPDNQTRFVVVSREGLPAPTGHDKTSIVVYQRANAPGSLLTILQEFAARSINLSKLESRPTKQGLGDYCFIIDLQGHIADDVVADCLRNIRMKQGDVKFLGSYPAAGSNGDEVRQVADDLSAEASNWIETLRAAPRGAIG